MFDLTVSNLYLILRHVDSQGWKVARTSCPVGTYNHRNTPRGTSIGSAPPFCPTDTPEMLAATRCGITACVKPEKQWKNTINQVWDHRLRKTWRTVEKIQSTPASNLKNSGKKYITACIKPEEQWKKYITTCVKPEKYNQPGAGSPPASNLENTINQVWDYRLRQTWKIQSTRCRITACVKPGKYNQPGVGLPPASNLENTINQVQDHRLRQTWKIQSTRCGITTCVKPGKYNQPGAGSPPASTLKNTTNQVRDHCLRQP